MYKVVWAQQRATISQLPLQSCVLRRLFSQRRESLYDILRVSRDSSQKQIREAFVKLTKQYHPDVSGAKADRRLTEQFVKISEAYQVLSKPQLRHDYDRQLSSHNGDAASSAGSSGGGVHTTESHQPWQVRPDVNANPGPYYGIDGLNRISNSKIAWVLIALAVFGAIFGFASVNHQFELNRNALDEKTAEANMHHAKVRADAAKYGNEEQLRRMMERMVKDEPPK